MPLVPSDINFCPRCRANLITSKDSFRAYSRVIGVEVPGVYSGALYWRCPDCRWAWHRWPPDTAWHIAAQRYIRQANNCR